MYAYFYIVHIECNKHFTHTFPEIYFTALFQLEISTGQFMCKPSFNIQKLFKIHIRICPDKSFPSWKEKRAKTIRYGFNTIKCTKLARKKRYCLNTSTFTALARVEPIYYRSRSFSFQVRICSTYTDMVYPCTYIPNSNFVGSVHQCIYTLSASIL